jgi:hypothetical protein
VLADIALEGEHADDDRRRAGEGAHQPRSCSLTSRPAISTPAIGTPRPV